MKPLAERIHEANRLLIPSAVPHEGRLGREVVEPEDTTRFPFQRDRDRIIHTYSFLRLQGKTQVFVAGERDHLRTRLTHTMEVAQISRDIARALSLNEDLAECIALAHDLGHPPFGHSGQDALDAWMKKHGSHFEHNEQSVRIVTVLEKHSSQYVGLNVNREVVEGLRKHEAIAHSLEARLVNIADAIAYNSHDCDDGLTADLFSREQLLQVPLAKRAYERSRERGTYIRGAIQSMLVEDLLEYSSLAINDREPISFSKDMATALAELQTFLWQNMYMHPIVRTQSENGQRIVTDLCEALLLHPIDKIAHLQQRTGSNTVEAIKDYVAGMTDAYAEQSLQMLKNFT
jgi:dGTPase